LPKIRNIISKTVLKLNEEKCKGCRSHGSFNNLSLRPITQLHNECISL
jgi:hypothetical protein